MWDLLVISIWLAIWGLTLLCAGHVLLNKRHPRGTALWLVIIFAFPLIGPYLYWLLGINRVRKKGLARARKRPTGTGIEHEPGAVLMPPKELFLNPALNAASAKVTGETLWSGNEVTPLYEGNEAFPAMLEAIGSAKSSVLLSTYILDRDAVGTRMIDALCSAAGRGLEVKVLVDGVGTSRKGISLARKLRSAGAQLAVFHPIPRLPFRYPSINMRNHRKIMVLDRVAGFTGGINITGRHFFSHRRGKELVHDIHFRVCGPVIHRMEDIFREDWSVATGSSTEHPPMPEDPCRGHELVRAIPSGPDENFERIYEVVLGALRSARSEVVIMTPYFIPDRALIQALRSAVLSGVRVRMILPSLSDHPLVQMASMAYLPELLEAGVEIYLAPPPFVHSKLMLVDGAWSLIGSANLDPRSFRLNFEFDLEVYSGELAGELIAYAETFLEGAAPLTREWVRGRPIGRRLMEGMAKVFSPYL
jgi:cardiolipin synthase